VSRARSVTAVGAAVLAGAAGTLGAAVAAGMRAHEIGDLALLLAVAMALTLVATAAATP